MKVGCGCLDGGDRGREGGRGCRPGERAEHQGHERCEGAAHGEVVAVEQHAGDDGGSSGEDGDADGREDAAEEVAPVRERGGPPPFEDAGLASCDETDAVGVPGRHGEAEGGIAGDVGCVGGGLAAVGGDEQDHGEADADGDRAATGQQAGLVADLGGEETPRARHPGRGGRSSVGHERVPSGMGGWPMAAR
jgi:hypothetical protein